MRVSSVATIRAASVRSSFFSSFAAAGRNSIVQAKLGFQRCQGDGVLAAEIAQALLSEEKILKVVEMRFDRLARIECLGPAGPRCEPIKAVLDFPGKADCQHGYTSIAGPLNDQERLLLPFALADPSC